MEITFSRNHNGDPLVLVDGIVKAIAKKCSGFDYLKLHILAFNAAPSGQPEPWYGHKFKENRGGEWRCDCGCDLKLFATPQVSDPQPAENAQSVDEAFELWFAAEYIDPPKGFKKQLREAFQAGRKHPVAQPAQDGLTDDEIISAADSTWILEDSFEAGSKWQVGNDEAIVFARKIEFLSRAHTASDRNAVLDAYIAFYEAWKAMNNLSFYKDGRNQAERDAACEKLDDAYDVVEALKDQPTAAPVSEQDAT